MLSAAALLLAGLFLISAPSSAAAAPRRSLDEAPSWDCNAPPGKNCQSRLGPTDDQSYAEWKADYDEWVAAGRAFFDFAAYSEPGIWQGC